MRGPPGAAARGGSALAGAPRPGSPRRPAARSASRPPPSPGQGPPRGGNFPLTGRPPPARAGRGGEGDAAAAASASHGPSACGGGGGSGSPHPTPGRRGARRSPSRRRRRRAPSGSARTGCSRACGSTRVRACAAPAGVSGPGEEFLRAARGRRSPCYRVPRAFDNAKEPTAATRPPLLLPMPERALLSAHVKSCFARLLVSRRGAPRYGDNPRPVGAGGRAVSPRGPGTGRAPLRRVLRPAPLAERIRRDSRSACSLGAAGFYN